MASTIEEISIEYFDENGTQTVKQLDKVVLTKGAWSTIMFLVQDWDAAKEQWKAPVARIERFRKMKGEYRAQSKFNISSAAQAKQVIEILQNWLDSGQFDGENA